MANFKTLNKQLKAKYPDLDIEVVRGDGYVYFDGEDGLGKIDSIYIHPPTISTEDLLMICISSVESYLLENLGN